MDQDKEKPLNISLRLPDDWSEPVANRDSEKCDIDGARLWISPGGRVYCDLVHNPSDVNREFSRREQTQP
jgi:hypothetical protein